MGGGDGEVWEERKGMKDIMIFSILGFFAQMLLISMMTFGFFNRKWQMKLAMIPGIGLLYIIGLIGIMMLNNTIQNYRNLK